MKPVHAFKGTLAGYTYCGVSVYPNAERTALLSRATHKPIKMTGERRDVTCKNCRRCID